MANILGWDRRIKYNALINGFELLRAFSDTNSKWSHDEALDVMRRIQVEFEGCLPDTSDFFEGLWQRSPKAISFGDVVNDIAGID